MPNFIAELRPTLSNRGPLELPYHLCRLEKSQPRLRRRLLLEPQISLKRYKAKAVIDWVDVAVVLGGKRTQGRYVQEHMVSLRGYVDGWVDGRKVERYTGHSFVCRIYDPLYEEVLEFLDRLKGWKGLATEPEVVGIEIAVDWYPQSQIAEERQQMVGLLRRHFLAPELINPEERAQRRSSQPRSFIRFGPKEEHRGVTEYVYEKMLTDRSSKEAKSHRPKGKSATVPPTKHTKVLDAEYQSPRLDGTYYVGASWDDVFWRIQDKTTDQRIGDKARDLPPTECRARIEVSLQRKPLRDLGLVSLEDVRSFNFEGLAKPYFRFWMATVPTVLAEAVGSDGRRLALRTKRKHYLRNVLCAGVYAALREDCREALSKRKANEELPRRERVKENGRSKTYRLGENAYLVSFEEMNRRTRGALRWLKF